ncbi:bifunctional sugar-binding transcriptional regulator/dihydroxyacetone kinase subunit DhaK [Jiella marina]|uniref:bifunctional sugar-binding transcriptional regulator/dihydroxyacetone kinase subunit DhaK n=1 Tax=Jiella sp. LLJ827 TaxID=2917712 RepID=UPI00210108D5|nr:bifunctional sugar-binding transcriptional regulator/dihydroxyacetone kinase subunit DhaK [Jiella sp. LLJ827]MCQ0986676.1 dihydroxyacetone kinase subunit DhaK [Jiella sp. LLJ827]
MANMNSAIARRSGNSGRPQPAAAPVPLRFRDDPLLWAGWLYAHDGMTQNEIAKAMGISRATVNNYLAEARSRGIVTLTMETSRLSEFMIAQALMERFDLSDCIVVPSAGEGRSLIDRLGETGARVLERLIRPGDAIGISWGRTMISLARNISHLRLPDLSVVQVTGGSTAPVDFTPELCVSQLATSLGARSINISAPAVVSSPAVRDILMGEPLVRDQFEMARKTDKIVFGICSTRPESSIHASGLIQREDLKHPSLQRSTAVIAGRFIDDRGKPVRGPLDDRTIGLTLEELREIKLRIAVAGGAEKTTAILAALRGRYANVLITDADTGHSILQAEGVPESLGMLKGTRRTQVQGGNLVKTKKLINDATNIIEEMLDGMIAAHPKHLRQLEGSPRSIVAVDGPREGKVGIVVGGGSGHEPTFVGYVGKGLADACAIGNVFASPPPDPILECTKAVDGGAGVLYLYGNYAGDVMNFDMAAEMAAMENIEVRTVLSTDDVASAPLDQKEKRRGVAGNFFIFKVTGAAADKMWSMDECERIAKKANSRTFTVGVALAPCSLPQTLRHNFELGPTEMEIGMGIHGEPGVTREPLRTADEVTDDILERIFAEMDAPEGSKVAVLVNSLGSTPLMELYVINRRVAERLERKGISVHATWVGTYCSSLEMAGMSITLIHLDDELTELLDHPCDCAMFRAG